MALISYLLADRQTSPGIEGLNLSILEKSMAPALAPATEIKEFRYEFLFVISWLRFCLFCCF